MDDYRMAKREAEQQLIGDMFKPVRCGRCRSVYDIGKVTITGRYTDCTMWRTPCCNQTVDDRCEYVPGWTSQIDYTVIDKTSPYPTSTYGEW